MSAAAAWQLKQCISTAPPSRCGRAFQVTDSDGLASSCSGQDAMNASELRSRV